MSVIPFDLDSRLEKITVIDPIGKLIPLGEETTRNIENAYFDNVQVFHKEYKPEKLYPVQYFSAAWTINFNIPYADSKHSCKAGGSPLLIFYNNTDETYNKIFLRFRSPIDYDDAYPEDVSVGHVYDLNVCPFPMIDSWSGGAYQQYYYNMANCFQTDSYASGGEISYRYWPLGWSSGRETWLEHRELKPGQLLYVTNAFYNNRNLVYYKDECYLYKE